MWTRFRLYCKIVEKFEWFRNNYGKVNFDKSRLLTASESILHISFGGKHLSSSKSVNFVVNLLIYWKR